MIKILVNSGARFEPSTCPRISNHSQSVLWQLNGFMVKVSGQWVPVPDPQELREEGIWHRTHWPYTLNMKH